jgi:hypothetical protein
MRRQAALFAAQDAFDHLTPGFAEPFIPFIDPVLIPVFLAARAAQLGDVTNARIARQGAASNPQIAGQIASNVIEALARGGATEEALAMARAARAPFPRIRNLAEIARRTRSPEALRDLEAAFDAVRGSEHEPAAAALIGTLAAIDRVEDAERLVASQGSAAHVRMLTALIEGIAQGGSANKAIDLSRRLADPIDRGYALVAVYEALGR